MLREKAKVLGKIRGFFEARGYTEVFTSPLLRYPNLDPNIGVFKVENEPLYLHTSPEYPMKKLLANEHTSIYQLAPVFRRDRQDSLHRKVFLMLEWYGIENTYLNLMDEAESLVVHLLSSDTRYGPSLTRRRIGSTIDLSPPWPRMRVAEAFEKWAGISLEELRDERALRNRFKELGIDYHPNDPWETRFNMLFVHCVEPRIRELGRPIFLYDYPVEVGLMAAPHPHDPSLVQRVELFAGELELMNGYTELTDPHEQMERWKKEARETVNADPALLQALPKLGLVAGAALGVDRLLMLLWEIEDISQVSLSE